MDAQSMKSAPQIALIAVTQKGVERARHLRQRLKTGEVYRPARYGHATAAWEHPYDTALAPHVAAWFAQYDHLVFFLATGAVTRLIAPCLDSKTTDPGVLAVDEAGRFVIPVLSGHQGGANAFARTVAGHLGATPVITTASDVIGGLSLDLLEETLGWVAEPAERLKAAAMALVNQEPVAIIQEVGQSRELAERLGAATARDLGPRACMRCLPSLSARCCGLRIGSSQTSTGLMPSAFSGSDHRAWCWA